MITQKWPPARRLPRGHRRRTDPADRPAAAELATAPASRLVSSPERRRFNSIAIGKEIVPPTWWPPELTGSTEVGRILMASAHHQEAGAETAMPFMCFVISTAEGALLQYRNAG